MPLERVSRWFYIIIFTLSIPQYLKVLYNLHEEAPDKIAAEKFKHSFILNTSDFKGVQDYYNNNKRKLGHVRTAMMYKGNMLLLISKVIYMIMRVLLKQGEVSFTYVKVENSTV